MPNMLKIIFDVSICLLSLPFVIPVFFVIAIIIKIYSPGTIFYLGIRAGKNGIPFRIVKFRTMIQEAEKLGSGTTALNDVRITKVGRFLRKYKLDELPQLINVLKGEMSLVGPRPQVPEDVALYTKEEKSILSVRPGITDWASIKYHNEGEILRGSPDPDQAYIEKIRPGKIKLELEYVRNHSFWIDLKILLKTVKTLFSTRL